MDLDPQPHLDAARRQVSHVTRDEVDVHLLTLGRDLPAPPEETWTALVDPERVGRWFLPLSGDLEVGGRFTLEGNASGEVLACDRPERFALTWEGGGSTSWVDVSLRPTDGGTLLQLDHAVPLDDPAWTGHGPAAVGIGWEMALASLAVHIDGGQLEIDVAAPSPAVRRFIEGSGRAWGEEDVESGTDAAQARDAAERTVRLYQGEQPEG